MKRSKWASRVGPTILALVLGPTLAMAQTSTNYKLTEHCFNAGGHPSGGSVPASASFKVSLDAIGDAVGGPQALSGPSYRMHAGFLMAYPPPGEVTGLLLLGDKETLVWDAESSVGAYKVYSGPLADLRGSGDYGACLESGITGTSTTDSTPLPPGTARQYLVTAENRIGEEGTKGWANPGGRRPDGPPCP